MSDDLFRLTPRAEADLDEIARRGLAAWGAGQMAAYLRQIDARMRWLGENPGLGRPRDEVRPGFRSWREGEHVIFYVGAAAPIAIIGVPHRLMHVGRYFRRGGASL